MAEIAAVSLALLVTETDSTVKNQQSIRYELIPIENIFFMFISSGVFERLLTSSSLSLFIFARQREKTTKKKKLDII